jgi:hypothetical protein
MFVGGLYISFYDHHADIFWTDKNMARELQLYGCQKFQFSFWCLTSGRRTESRDGGSNGVDASATAEGFARRVVGARLRLVNGVGSASPGSTSS